MSIPWWKVSAVQVVQALKDGRVTPLELIASAERRILETDDTLNACPILCFDRARSKAAQLQAKGAPKDGRPGYLHGLPLIVKDTQAVAGVRFTEGSLVHRDRVAEASDPLVEALERSGAVVVAKSNTPEFAAGSNTYNAVFGATANPWDTRATCGGSSGGAAAALAAGQAWLATGSDLGGSCRIPASFCGVVGMRPSPFLTPKAASGFAPLEGFRLFSVNGPLARNVADAALFLDAMVHGREREQGAAVSEPSFLEAVQGALARGELPGPGSPRVGFSSSLGGEVPMGREVVAVCRGALSAFAAVGADRVEGIDGRLEGMMRGSESVFQTLRAHMFVEMAPLLEAHRDLLKPELVWNISKGLQQADAEVAEAIRCQQRLEREFSALFGEFSLICLPAVMLPPFDVGTHWVRELETEKGRVEFTNYAQWLAATSVITLTNCPAVSIPCGMTSSGLPIGLQIVAAPGADAFLLSAAALLERAMPYSSMVPIDPRRNRDGAVM